MAGKAAVGSLTMIFTVIGSITCTASSSAKLSSLLSFR
jgi:hypothetical protein